MTSTHLPPATAHDRRCCRFSSLAVLLCGALSLSLPSGYSVGPALLLLATPLLLWYRPRLALARDDYLIMAGLTLYTAIVIAGALWHDQAVRTLDKPLRLWLAIPVMLWLMAFPPRLAALWAGIALGGLGAGGVALGERLVTGAPRVNGFDNVIQFGNLSLLLGMFCIAGLGWATTQPHRKRWATLLIAGALGGLLASLLSGSRGGWVGLPFMLLVLYRAWGQDLPGRTRFATALTLVLGIGLLYSLPQTGIQQRVDTAVNDLVLYFQQDTVTSSLGFRFDMWRGATHLALEKPLLGWGEEGYAEGMGALAEAGVIHPATAGFGHAHNQFIDTLAKQGALGLAGLLLLYGAPLVLFTRQLRADHLPRRAIATGGALLSVAYIDFSLSQSFLTHNSGVMFFGFWVAIWWSLMYRCRPPRDTASHAGTAARATPAATHTGTVEHGSGG